MPSGKMGYLITETKFDRNFPLVDSRNIEESFSFYEKNWEKIVSASKKFLKNMKKIFVFALNLLKVSVADLVKLALSRVKSVTFFSRIFISHVEDFDLFGGFTDIGFVFPGIVLHVTDFEFSKIFRYLDISSIHIKGLKKLKNVVTPFCLERNSEQSCVLYKNSKIFGNFRIF